MSKFRKGADGFKRPAGGGPRNWINQVQWKDGDRIFLQFLTPLAHIPTVLWHEYIIVGYRDNGKPRFEQFVSGKDPGIGGPDGYDPIWDRFDIAPKSRSIAIAAVLDPIEVKQGAKKRISGVDVNMRTYENRDGEEVSKPNIGLVIQSSFNFFGWLETFENDSGVAIEDAVFSVTRRGAKNPVSYDFVHVSSVEAPFKIEVEGEGDDSTFNIAGFPPGVTAEDIPNLEEYLVKLGDPDRYKELIDPLPDDFVLSQYADKKPAKSNGRPAQAQEKAP